MADDGLTKFFEPDEGKTAFDDTDQEWYFDLPSGAWERQEQKNRELRQQVKRNTSERDAASVPFARAAMPFRRAAAWQSAGGTWGLNGSDSGEDSGVSPAPLRVPRKEGDEASGSRWNSIFGDYEAPPDGQAEDAEPGADESIVGQMRGWADSRTEADGPPGGAVPLLRRDGRAEEPAGEPASASLWGGAFGQSEPPTRRRVLAPAPILREGEEPPPPTWISGSLPPSGSEPRRNLWLGADEPHAGEEPGRPRRNLFAESQGGDVPAAIAGVETVLPSPVWLEEPYGPEDQVELAEEMPAALLEVDIDEADELDLPGDPESSALAAESAPVDITTLALSAGIASLAVGTNAAAESSVRLPEKDGRGLGDGGLPPLRRDSGEETAVLPGKDMPAMEGEPTSRWDQVFAGQAVGGDLIDAMREWLVHEKEAEARARDITLLPPELLQPFDWENDTDAAGITFEADAGAGVSVASLAGHIWMESRPPAVVESQSQPAEDVAAAWHAPVPDEAWEPGPGLARITAASSGEPSDGEQWGGSSWAELAPGGGGDATKKKGGLLGRLFGKGSKPEASSNGPEWAMGGPSAWTAPAISETAPRPTPPPRAADWAPIDGPIQLAPDWSPAAAPAEPPAEKDSALLPEPLESRAEWDDTWFELPAGRLAQSGAIPPDRPARSLFEVRRAETLANDAFAAVESGPHNDPESDASASASAPPERPALYVVPPSEAADDPWAAFIAARQEEETPFRFTSEGDARHTGSLG